MLGKRITIFKLFGFEVRIDISWVFLACLITWSLAQGFFPYHLKNLSQATYWWMGVAGSLGLFISIIFHELWHSLVARRYGLPIKGITLFIFGGVAEMDEEPPSAKVEFLMAIVGPISSILLSFVFHEISILGKRSGWPEPINSVLSYLGLINLILAGFNLLPAFPLDGGRMLRSILWNWKHNLRWATRLASQIGSTFGIGMIILGIIYVFLGNFIGGIWWFLIGMFLQSASRMSYQQLSIRKALEGEHVLRFMNSHPVIVPPSISVEQLVEDYFYKYHFKMIPVVENSKLIGCVTTRQVKEIPRQEWSQRRVGDITEQCSPENTISPETDAVKALSTMSRSSKSRLMVVDNGRLIGVIALKDMMKFLSLKLDLENSEDIA